MALIDRQRIMGQRAMVSRVVLHKGFVLPAHAHENEQISIVLSGRVRFRIESGGENCGSSAAPAEWRDVELGAGEILLIPSGAPHGATALEETVILDIFAPPSATTGVDAPVTH